MRARKRMMANVSTATVVITNPTHYAVALSYEKGLHPAPRVVAKGADDVAARIREAALKNSVPIVANPPLARALFRLDLEIFLCLGSPDCMDEGEMTKSVHPRTN